MSRASASSRGKPKSGAALLAQAIGIAEPQPRGAAGLVLARAGGARGRPCHLEVALQLLRELAVELAALSHERQPAQQCLEPDAHQAVSSTRAIAATSASQRSRSASSRLRPRAVSL